MEGSQLNIPTETNVTNGGATGDGNHTDGPSLVPHERRETIVIEIEKKNQSDHTANAKAVAAAIDGVVSLVERVHQEYEADEKFLAKARPLAEGSLQIPIDLILYATSVALIETNFFDVLRRILKEFFEARLTFGGNRIEVENGNVIVFENSRLHVEALTTNMLSPESEQSQKFDRAFAEIDRDEEVKGVSIRSSAAKEPLLRASRPNFQKLKTPVNEPVQPPPKLKTDRQTLIVRTASFDPRLNWNFRWAKRFISATILDEKFMRDVQSATELFGNGDTMEVDLLRVVKPDGRESDYRIMHVHSHVHAPKQPNSLFGE